MKVPEITSVSGLRSAHGLLGLCGVIAVPSSRKLQE
jgi:hypothetical protein